MVIVARSRLGGAQPQQHLAPNGVVVAGVSPRPQRSLILGGGLLIGAHVHGPVAGPSGIGERFARLASGRRLGEVTGQLRNRRR